MGSKAALLVPEFHGLAQVFQHANERCSRRRGSSPRILVDIQHTHTQRGPPLPEGWRRQRFGNACNNRQVQSSVFVLAHVPIRSPRQLLPFIM